MDYVISSSSYLFLEVDKQQGGAIWEVWVPPAFGFIAETRRDANGSIGAAFERRHSKRSLLPPDVHLERSRTRIVDDLATTQCHLGKLTRARVALSTNDTVTTTTLASCHVARPTKWTNFVAVTRDAAVGRTEVTFLIWHVNNKSLMLYLINSFINQS